MKKHIDLPYCRGDILPFLGSFKMFNIITDALVPPVLRYHIREAGKAIIMLFRRSVIPS